MAAHIPPIQTISLADIPRRTDSQTNLARASSPLVESRPMSRTSSGLFNRDSAFDCNICMEIPTDPVVTMCGHLYCWPCLYKWLDEATKTQSTCPVCKANTTRDKIIPLYGRGKTAKTHSMNTGQGIPQRPAARHASTPSAANGNAAVPITQLHYADVFAGAGFLSTLFGTQFRDDVAINGGSEPTTEQKHLATLSRILLFLGSCIIFSLIML